MPPCLTGIPQVLRILNLKSNLHVCVERDSTTEPCPQYKHLFSFSFSLSLSSLFPSLLLSLSLFFFSFLFKQIRSADIW